MTAANHSMQLPIVECEEWICTRCNHLTALECKTANCTCCTEEHHDVNVVKDEQEIEEMKTVKKFE